MEVPVNKQTGVRRPLSLCLQHLVAKLANVVMVLPNMSWLRRSCGNIAVTVVARPYRGSCCGCGVCCDLVVVMVVVGIIAVVVAEYWC